MFDTACVFECFAVVQLAVPLQWAHAAACPAMRWGLTTPHLSSLDCPKLERSKVNSCWEREPQVRQRTVYQTMAQTVMH